MDETTAITGIIFGALGALAMILGVWWRLAATLTELRARPTGAEVEAIVTTKVQSVDLKAGGVAARVGALEVAVSNAIDEIDAKIDTKVAAAEQRIERRLDKQDDVLEEQTKDVRQIREKQIEHSMTLKSIDDKMTSIVNITRRRPGT